MCGIVGYIGENKAQEVILSGLQKLEYRGYDSAGIALLENGEITVTRAQGKLEELKKKFTNTKSKASLGIGHTRWATHGRPSETNAHPHSAGRVSLIHNGIIENYLELKEELEKLGCEFKSETDTEIAAHLLNQEIKNGLEPFEALKATCKKVRGSYAFLAIDKENPDRILVAKNSTPIVIGFSENQKFIASDIPAILNYTKEVLILEDGDIAEIMLDSIKVENDGVLVTRKTQTINWDPVTAQKGGYKHFMLKEIYDQVEASVDTVRGRIKNSKVVFSNIDFSVEEAKSIDRIIMIACGTAWHACLVAKYYFETLAGIPCEVDYSSEFRYRDKPVSKNTLLIPVSQSGETLDTLAATESISKLVKTLAICNVLGSSLSRKVENVIYTQAGPEISVASTKAFTTQLEALYMFALFLGQERGILNKSTIHEKVNAVIKLPAAIAEALKDEEAIKKTAKLFYQSQDFFYIGRGICFPIALEGALKLKEISYIHAEGYPAGELKHGPLALIDEDVPVVVILQKSDVLFEKTLSNLKEVEARGGKIIAITDSPKIDLISSVASVVHSVPFISGDLSPILMTVPLQLLAYYIAVFNGTDVDLPRNLAKSVTVE